MSSERQRNIVVELTLAGLTTQYIVDKFDCSISTLWQIRKVHKETGRWQRSPTSGRPKETTVRDERYLGRHVMRIRFRSLAQVSEAFVTHLVENLVDSVENRNHPLGFQHDNALAHAARRTVAWLGQQGISTIQRPDPGTYYNKTSLGFYGHRYR